MAPVEASGGAEVEVFDAGAVAQLGRFEPGGQSSAVPGVGLPVDEQTQSVLEGELTPRSGGGELLDQAGGHRRQARGPPVW